MLLENKESATKCNSRTLNQLLFHGLEDLIEQSVGQIQRAVHLIELEIN